ncbi:hypothetical protein PHYBLDRAFT_68946 [Phycomyces blakesleeanus NRRL 1555(-)]|uniref:Uncharacterized protein n=1 Tax=Phycomyces blakesleeanus (strain ATCC 8743b / DSM 1359 / FGSC 10004 / NBRC 33097 / NRRL 1555) TaxID=763407 RepID=A0A162TMP5_PHYB8|nr:hypothetical protein PHYBLDRAFT_68946 [Phycomyces blakesleeanus NRRL 1555(-)]OAD68393.1 hypothetical protein PHYBLDRAFT_68946 [Phycomyces blakesleeanus NRRL 1555(-)]|eukprot:XP_018286433.1 hypothetical protein PHYBLDRAFT_68946 [Phycomyces blakesleeanus NRRL 1555(-)]
MLKFECGETSSILNKDLVMKWPPSVKFYIFSLEFRSPRKAKEMSFRLPNWQRSSISCSPSNINQSCPSHYLSTVIYYESSDLRKEILVVLETKKSFQGMTVIMACKKTNVVV